jgi:hypothetical protein
LPDARIPAELVALAGGDMLELVDRIAFNARAPRPPATIAAGELVTSSLSGRIP